MWKESWRASTTRHVGRSTVGFIGSPEGGDEGMHGIKRIVGFGNERCQGLKYVRLVLPHMERCARFDLGETLDECFVSGAHGLIGTTLHEQRCRREL